MQKRARPSDLELAEPLGWPPVSRPIEDRGRVWNATDIRDMNVLRKVLAQMQSAERGLATGGCFEHSWTREL